jgi:hypothetical protein
VRAWIESEDRIEVMTNLSGAGSAVVQPFDAYDLRRDCHYWRSERMKRPATSRSLRPENLKNASWSGGPPRPRSRSGMASRTSHPLAPSPQSRVDHPFTATVESGLYQGLLWSGRRDSNPRPSPWQGDALPLRHFRVGDHSIALTTALIEMATGPTRSLRHRSRLEPTDG